MRRKPARGFTLLEAIVALAILSAGGMALFAAMTQSVQMVNRAEQAREDDTALRNAMAWLEQVNPMQAPDGSMPLGDYELRWTSRLVEPVRPGATGYLEPGLYDVGLYELELQLWRGDTLRRELPVRRVGWRQARQPVQM